MSMSKLAVSIMSAFTSVSIISKQLDISGGNIQTQNTTPMKNEDGTYDVTFNVTVPSREFAHIEDGEVFATKADTDMQVELTGVTHSETDGWAWKESDTASYTVTAGDVAPNIVVYKGDTAYGDFDNDDFYSGGLTEEEDRDLSKVLAKNIIDWSDNRSLAKAFSDMAKTIDFPVEAAMQGIIMTDTLIDITNVVIEGFAGQAISKANLSLANKSTGSRPFSPMRNSKGLFDVPVCISCLSAPMEQIEGIENIDHADVVLTVVLQDCKYSHDNGFSWNEVNEAYKFIDHSTKPSIVFYNGDIALNGSGTDTNYLEIFDKTMDLQCFSEIKDKILKNTSKDKLFSIFSELLNQGDLYTKDGKN